MEITSYSFKKWQGAIRWGPALLICAFYVLLRLYALAFLPPIGDEYEDVSLIFRDLFESADFFKNAAAPDQARLQHWISIPVVLVSPQAPFQTLVPLRLMFHLFYWLYLFFSYRLLRLVTGQVHTAFLYVFLLSASCYLNAFSIFSITTGGWLYALFHILSLFYFYRAATLSREKNEFSNYLGIAVLFGLCTASKLFGVLLIASLLIYHMFNAGFSSVLSVRDTHLFRLFLWNSVYGLGYFLINFLKFSPPVQFWASLGMAILYLLFLKPVCAKKGIFRCPFVVFWLILLMTAANIAFIFSPIYWNFDNVLAIFDWGRKWNESAAAARHIWYDIPQMMIVKLGFPSMTAVLTALGAAYFFYRRQRFTFNASSFTFLIVLIFGIHFAAISLVRFTAPWYPLVIFPFLFLPLAGLWQIGYLMRSRIPKIIALLLTLVVLADNSYRYFKWFPYAHFDGAQYGNSFIGWDKPGYVSFEVLPSFHKFMRHLAIQEKKPLLRLNWQPIDVPKYKRWGAEVFQYHFQKHGGPRIELREGEQNFDYLISSPLYNPSLEAKLKKSEDFRHIKTLGLKGLEMISVWRKKD